MKELVSLGWTTVTQAKYQRASLLKRVISRAKLSIEKEVFFFSLFIYLQKVLLFSKCLVANYAKGELSNQGLGFLKPRWNLSKTLWELQQKWLSMLKLQDYVGIGGRGCVALFLQSL